MVIGSTSPKGVCCSTDLREIHTILKVTTMLYRSEPGCAVSMVSLPRQAKPIRPVMLGRTRKVMRPGSELVSEAGNIWVRSDEPR